MNYKEVFQLAQDKGYLPCERFLNGNGFRSPEFETEEVQLLELTLIQKWLREQHHIDLAIRLDYEAGKYFYDLDAPNWEPIISDELSDTYEQALLEGIAEALKLI
jgi:hypothetical protein